LNNAEIEKFFRAQDVNILGNTALREPQREGYFALKAHFDAKGSPCYVQLPVGNGKTGLMGLAPFGIADGRVLIVAPNLVIRKNIIRDLNVSDSNCFYRKRGIFVPSTGPFISELKTGANLYDCDNAHIVVANIQQFAGKANKWYEKFPNDYFRMILVDEGHHGVADTWQKLFEYFNGAKIISFTATPMRSDGRVVEGERVYTFSYARSMMMGIISPIEAVFVKPEEITFTVKNATRTLTLDQVMEMREHEWFSKGIALSEECNRNIVTASLDKLDHVRQYGTPRQIIAVACSIRHAEQIAALYREHGMNTEVLHSNLSDDRREEIEAGLRNGTVDVVVQVNILGEGYDLGTLSIAAVFRPYRSLTPYIQFVGRILRLAAPEAQGSPANHVYLVSHVGLNDERWWDDFRDFDAEDKEFFAEYFSTEETVEESAGKPRQTLRPFMKVLDETVHAYVQKGFLKEIDETLIHEVMGALESRGFHPAEFGLTEDMMRMRLEMAAQAEKELPANKRIVQPQKKREALQVRVSKEARSIADTVLNRLDLAHAGRDLINHFPGKGPSNSVIMIALAGAAQNTKMGIEKNSRNDATIEQLQQAIDASPDIVDSLSAVVRKKIKGGS
jgi:superfamily II DNA or RNA helicase